MSGFSYYLHEKAEESRHNESVSLLIAVIGSVFFVGGFLQRFLTAVSEFGYLSGSSSYEFLGLAFNILGLILVISGAIMAVYYASNRSWYNSALKERYNMEEETLRAQKKSKNNKPQLSTLAKTSSHDIPELQPMLEKVGEE